MRNTTKGGVWRNTEDEILKVAIMKYGLNQWARVSSLLSRKTPAQCKARWYQWLDPSIKKTEWTKEEEEKLLHLAKIFPSQWETISHQLYGRTSAQCLEHYNKLLNEVQRQITGEGGNNTTGEEETGTFMKSRFESDPNPETKPAKPDPIDMDEEEKESLSEAKARLSNTHGKKEKRKLRERSLQEAKRLAQLQKNRELKAAGQHVKIKRKKENGRFDLENEIPYFKKPQSGYYNVPESETQNQKGSDREFFGKSIAQLDNPHYDQEQEKLNKIEELKKKRKELTDLPSVLMKTSKSNDIDQRIIKKSKMKLPLPQLTDEDLDEIAEYEKENGSEALKQKIEGQRTQRTPMIQDSVMAEAQNLYYQSQAQTPLKGGVTPKPLTTTTTTTTTGNSQSYGLTPNPILQTISTPKRFMTPQAQLEEEREWRNEERLNQNALKKKIASDLKSLPKPKNQIKVSLPDNAPSLDDDDLVPMSLDNSEKHIREEQELKHKEQFKLRNRSTVLKLGLPRLITFGSGNTSNNIDNLIESEIQSIIYNDNKLFPISNSIVNQQQQKLQQNQQPFEIFSNVEMDNVDLLIKDEMNKYSKDERNSYLEFIKNELDNIREQQVPCKGTLVDKKDSLDSKVRVQILQDEFQHLQQKMNDLSNKSVNLQKKLNVYNGGYQNRANQLLKSIEELYNGIDDSNIKFNCFEDLRSNEIDAMESRIKSIQNDLYDQVQLELNLQNKYSKLLKERNSLIKQ